MHEQSQTLVSTNFKIREKTPNITAHCSVYHHLSNRFSISNVLQPLWENHICSSSYTQEKLRSLYSRDWQSCDNNKLKMLVGSFSTAWEEAFQKGASPEIQYEINWIPKPVFSISLHFWHQQKKAIETVFRPLWKTCYKVSRKTQHVSSL